MAATQAPRSSSPLPNYPQIIKESLFNDNDKIEESCKAISELVGDRELLFCTSLSHVEDATSSIAEEEKILALLSNFMTINNNMPDEIIKKSSVSNAYAQIIGKLLPSLDKYCDWVNNQNEYSGFLYEMLLALLGNATQHNAYLEIGNFKALSSSFDVIKDKIPKKIAKTPIINNRITTISTALTFRQITNSMHQATTKNQLDQINKQLNSCYKLLTPSLKREFKETKDNCSFFINDKYLITHFVDHHLEDGPLRKLDRSRVHRILSIDGGGIRGIIPATMLVEIEKITHKPISELFDLIGGTSTGGILALGLTKPDASSPGSPHYSAQDLLNLYTQEHPEVFQENPDRYRPETVERLGFVDGVKYKMKNPKYLSNRGLFRSKFGNTLLSGSLKDLLITANTTDAVIAKASSMFCATGASALSILGNAFFGSQVNIFSHNLIPKKVHYFTRNRFNDLSYDIEELQKPKEDYRQFYNIKQICEIETPMSLAAMVTSAAPTFFPTVPYNGYTLLDGGVLQNNPAIPCVLESLRQGKPREDLFMLSLGTGVISDRYKFISGTPSNPEDLWFETVQPNHQIEKAIDGNMLSYGAYHRFQCYYTEKPHDLDAHTEVAINSLREIGRELVEDNLDRLRDVCRVIDPDGL